MKKIQMPATKHQQQHRSIRSERVQRRAYRMLPGVGIVPPPVHTAHTPADVVAPRSTRAVGPPAGVVVPRSTRAVGTPAGVVVPRSTRAVGTPAGVVAPPFTHKAARPAGVVGAKLNTYGDAPAGTNFAYFGGPVIGNVDVQLVFWGKEWGTAPPVAPTDIQNRVNSILNGPYMSKLTQYGCAGKGRIRGTTFVTDQDPPNPFNDGSVQSFIIGLTDDETLPEPDED